MTLTKAERNERAEHAEFCRTSLAKHIRGGSNLYFMQVHTSPGPAYRKHYRILAASADAEGNKVVKDLTSLVCGLLQGRWDDRRGTFVTTNETQAICSAIGLAMYQDDNAFDPHPL